MGWDIKPPKLDERSVQDGVWMPIGNGEAEALVRPASNPDFLRRLTQLQGPYKQQIKAGNLSERVQLEIYAQAIAETVLLDWRNVFIGEEPADIKDAKDLMLEFPALLHEVVTASANRQAFERVEHAEDMEALGNDSASN